MGLWSYDVFNLTGAGYPQIFSAPSSKTMRQTSKRFRGARTCSRSSITIPSLVWHGFHAPPGWRKTLSFLSVRHAFLVHHALSVHHAFERQSCSHDFAMKALENRNDPNAVG